MSLEVREDIEKGFMMVLQVVYYVASVVVLYSAEAHTQRHYRGHTEDIESICVHPQVSLHHHHHQGQLQWLQKRKTS